MERKTEIEYAYPYHHQELTDSLLWMIKAPNSACAFVVIESPIFVDQEPKFIQAYTSQDDSNELVVDLPVFGLTPEQYERADKLFGSIRSIPDCETQVFYKSFTDVADCSSWMLAAYHLIYEPIDQHVVIVEGSTTPFDLRVWLSDFQGGNEEFRRELMSQAWDSIRDAISVLRQFMIDSPDKDIEDALAYTLEGSDAQYRENAIAGFTSMFDTLAVGNNQRINNIIKRAVNRVGNSAKS